MNTRFWLTLLTATVLCSSRVPGWADREQELITVLQSSADIPAKCDACRELRVIGTIEAIPALSALLGHDRVSEAARYALEGMPFREASAALLEAVGRTAGANKAGVIDSLGWRRDAAAFPVFTGALADADPAIASAAAASLGRLGNKEASAALISALGTSPQAVLPFIQAGLLQCAESLLAAGDTKGAVSIYSRLCDAAVPETIRVAAWRGRVVATKPGRQRTVFAAAIGTDAALRQAALETIRELRDPGICRAGLKKWDTLPEDVQLAVFDAATQLKRDTAPAIRLASQAKSEVLRTAAWECVGRVNDWSFVPSLARAAAGSSAGERDAARQALARLNGPSAREAILKGMSSAETGSKAELLRVLGERGDRGSVSLLLEYASGAAPELRAAALESLRRLAASEAVLPLLQLAAKSEAGAEPVLDALYASCQATSDKALISSEVLKAMGSLSDVQRNRVLPVLAELGTPDALQAAVRAARADDVEVRRAAVRVLSDWPSAAPSADLIALAKASRDAVLQTLALRGAVKVMAHEPDQARRFALLRQAMVICTRPEEKRAVLAQLGQVPTVDALGMVIAFLDEPELVNEAGLAAVSIAEKLAPSDVKAAAEAASRVIEKCKAPAVVKRAWDLRGGKLDASPFVQDWLVCGPYSRQGVAGAIALFPIAFGPETTESVQWKALPRGDSADLYGGFPGFENCVAYLKTRLVAPAPMDALLLLGSDDGVKAWVNGEVVHENNVDRGQKPDEDKVPIRLKSGANELMLKVTQGGGGWSACARVVGADGQPVPGLRAEAQSAPAVTIQSAAPAALAPIVPSALPPKDPRYRKLRLSDQFYAEGAYFADFNQDGKLDVVAGPFWFEGPDFRKRHEYRPVLAFEAAKEYSDNFLTYAGDMNNDGWADVLFIPYPGTASYWYENPAGKQVGHWKRHLAYDNTGNESPMWDDVIGLGRPQLLFCKDGYLGYAYPDFSAPEAPWVFHAISTENPRYQKFTHGIGFGDITGDKRNDVVEAAGWWEQPAEMKNGQPWTWHPHRFAEAGAQMYVYDVDGDGLSDVITAWHCHLYGLLWWKQERTAEAKISWVQRVILPPVPDTSTADFRVSQLHSMVLTDMNGDGVLDILTGKRFWAHGPTGDKEPDAPAVVFWYELRRGGPAGASFTPHLIDDDSGVGTQVAATDLNGDKQPDVVVANKKGVFVHLSHPTGE